jgi:osmotically-inducible protein OsmY
MRTPQLLCSVVAISAALAGCQRSTAQADVNAAKADAKQTATNVASDVKAGTETVAAKAGDELSDAWITTKIQSKFVADHEINAREIKVSSRDGVVTLRGLIQNEPMRSLAVAVAKNTTGVKQVLDQLSVTVAAPVALHADANSSAPVAIATSGSVAGGGPRPAGSPDDGRITSSIQAKYYLDDKLKGRRIHVDTTNGVVTLRGDVGSESERGEALLLARTSEGVKRVEDNLIVLEEQP